MYSGMLAFPFCSLLDTALQSRALGEILSMEMQWQPRPQESHIPSLWRLWVCLDLRHGLLGTLQNVHQLGSRLYLCAPLLFFIANELSLTAYLKLHYSKLAGIQNNDHCLHWNKSQCIWRQLLHPHPIFWFQERSPTLSTCFLVL